MADRKDPLPVTRQCALLDLPRSTFYHVPRPVSEEELEMALVDRCHLRHPFYGSRRIQFTGVLKRHDIRISMDGKERWIDNVFVERLWRSVKYEEVYLKACDSMAAAKTSPDWYVAFYNTERWHQSNRLTGARRTASTTNLLPEWRLDQRRHLSRCPIFGGHFSVTDALQSFFCFSVVSSLLLLAWLRTSGDIPEYVFSNVVTIFTLPLAHSYVGIQLSAGISVSLDQPKTGRCN